MQITQSSGAIGMKGAEVDIKQRRLAMGLTQRELARRCGCCFQHMNKIENGKTNPSIELSVRIRDVLDGKLTEGLISGAPFKGAEKQDLRRIWLEGYAPRRKGEI